MRKLLVIISVLFFTSAGAQQKFFMVKKSAGSAILDTLAGNVYLNSTGLVSDSTKSGWNNIAEGAGGGVVLTSQPLKWKHNYATSSGVTVSFFHGSNVTSTTTCTDQLAPNSVMSQMSFTAGSTGTDATTGYQIGDPTTGGRILTFSNVPQGTWTFIYLASRWSGASLTQTVNAVNQSGQTGTVDVYQNCTNQVILTNLIPSGGVIQIQVRGTTNTASTYLSGFYLIRTAP